MNYDPAPVMSADYAVTVKVGSPSLHVQNIYSHLVLETTGHACLDKLRGGRGR